MNLVCVKEHFLVALRVTLPLVVLVGALIGRFALLLLQIIEMPAEFILLAVDE